MTAPTAGAQTITRGAIPALLGGWQACFMSDSTTPRLEGLKPQPTSACGEVRFLPQAACGPQLEYRVPLGLLVPAYGADTALVRVG